jgi:hypothetical protein
LQQQGMEKMAKKDYPHTLGNDGRQ